MSTLKRQTLLTWIALCSALAACTGGGVSGSGTVPSLPQAAHTSSLRPSATGTRGLYVNDFLANTVDILNLSTYANIGSFSVSSPNGNWIAGKYLYIANGNTVVQYSLATLQPVFTYMPSPSNPFVGAQNVTTDSQQNVYVADDPGHTIWKFSQKGGSGTGVDLGAPAPTGVAVDGQGDIYVAAQTGVKKGGLIEIPAGSGTPVTLSPTFGQPGGMIMDSSGNLLVCDQTNNDVAVIAQPYTQITKTYTGLSGPFNLALTKTEKRLFVVELNANDIKVLAYPSGTVKSTITGFSLVTGVAAKPGV
jgi:hypothetical protein